MNDTMRLHGAWAAAIVAVALAAASQADELEPRFRELPMEARRLTGPLFWLHGDDNETKARLEMYLDKIAEGGNGCFTAESRPHSDWLGPRWYEDLNICLQKAKQLDLQMWIFDERWWPSQGIGGKVLPQYSAKKLDAAAVDVDGPRAFEADGYGGERYIAAVAGRTTADGKIDGDSLIDLKPFVQNGALRWQAPAGRWKIVKFTHKQAPGFGQGGQLSVDGASRDCTDWFLQTVYQPHYDHFKEDFGKSIMGFFYDEPETRGDWGTEVDAVLAEWHVDWKKAYVAYKFQLAGEEDVAARFQYMEALAEAWGRVMYGGMSRWCREHRVVSMGHFMEHGYLYVHPDFCAGDMMRLQKYSDMGGIDLVCRQMYPGQRPHDIYQTPKLGSSISHVYHKTDDITMCEMFGGYNQELTYAEMKWLTDQMQVRGVNFMIPHSFNPRSPNDRDFPPYFYNSGLEPRWPLYRVYADYTNRLSLLLTGGRHVCPVALLFGGNTRRVGKAVTPEDMTSALQDVLYDCDWMPFEVLESTAALDGKDVRLHEERYQAIVVPPTEVIPYAALAKAKEFFDGGGVVIGYGFLPSKSGTLGRSSADVAALRDAIWTAGAAPATTACGANAKGGRSYFLPEKPSPQEIAQVLAKDAGVPPVLEVLEGDTGGWLHALHRVKDGRDVFLVCNQNHEGSAREFRLRLRAKGTPECWDAMRNDITSVPFTRADEGAVDVRLTLEPMESVLLVFREKPQSRPSRISGDVKPVGPAVPIARVSVAKVEPPAPEPKETLPLENCRWVWYPDANPRESAPPGVRFFRGTLDLEAGKEVAKAEFALTADNDFTLHVNGAKAAQGDGSDMGWRQVRKVDLARRMRPGRNQFAIVARNFTDKPNPAGLIGRYRVVFGDGTEATGSIDKTWKASDREAEGWMQADFDDSQWPAAKEIARLGEPPWGPLGRDGTKTLSPFKDDTFVGCATLPADVDLKRSRFCLQMDDLPHSAARVKINGVYAGGAIGKPWRLDVTRLLKAGENAVEIAPFAPAAARLVPYPGASD